MMRLLYSLILTFMGFLCAMAAVVIMMGDPKPGTVAVRWPAIPFSFLALLCGTMAMYQFVRWGGDLARRVQKRREG